MTRVFPEVEDVLRTLQGRAYRLALITNTQGQREEGKHRLGDYPELERLFEVIVVAGEGGIPPKPDPAPFRLCLDTMGFAPEEAHSWATTGGSTSAGRRPLGCGPSG